MEDINKEKKQFSSNLFSELTRLRNIDNKIQTAIDNTRAKNQEHKDNLKEYDETINEICDKRNKETEKEADLIEETCQNNKDKIEWREKKEKEEKNVKEKQAKVDMSKEYNKSLHEKNLREHEFV